MTVSFAAELSPTKSNKNYHKPNADTQMFIKLCKLTHNLNNVLNFLPKCFQEHQTTAYLLKNSSLFKTRKTKSNPFLLCGHLFQYTNLTLLIRTSKVQIQIQIQNSVFFAYLRKNIEFTAKVIDLNLIETQFQIKL